MLQLLHGVIFFLSQIPDHIDVMTTIKKQVQYNVIPIACPYHPGWAYIQGCRYVCESGGLGCERKAGKI